ncbi:hypothetical protein A3K73_03280 [Candidatus Pacearchaeota archaeon RBG_13_36_9]|nr:MAG: hypothetical protein A3K73_03280 [Candidatus Pacearchaeota archaeon RBG_13_36_9]
MNFNFKKITSVIASAVMLGSTIGFAAAANYPAPFVQGGAANVGIVMGADAANSDYLAAVGLGQALQAELAKQTATTTTTGGTTSGEGVNMATSARGLYYGDALNVARTTLTSSELPNVLADGTFGDLTGTEYTYNQQIVVGNTVTTFDTSGGDLDDPVLYLDVGTVAGDPLYNYTLSFNKNLNVSDSTNVQGQKISILGVDYIIGAGSTNTTLYLYGSGETIVVSQDEAQTVSIGGDDHVIELVTTTGTNTAKISVDGSTRSVTKSSRYQFPGDVVVYVKDVTHPSYQGDLRSVELIIGAKALKLENGKKAKTGAEEASIKETNVVIAAAEHGVISGLTVQVAMANSETDHLAAGDSFTDPVFGGLSVQLSGAVPALDSEARGTIKVDTDNSRFGYLTFTSAKAGSAGEQKLTYAYDNDTSDSTTQPLLAHQTIASADKGHIWVVEGQNAKEGDWIVVNQGDSGVILEIDDIENDPDALTIDVTLTDAITQVSETKTLANATGGFTKEVSMFGGTGYTIYANRAGTTLNITWDSTTATTVFPRIKLKDGGYLALLTDETIANGTSIILPNGDTTLTTSGTKISNETGYLTVGEINWTVYNNAGSAEIVGIEAGTTDCNFSAAAGPAVLFIEPKKWDDSTYGDFICVPLTITSGSSAEIKVGTPVVNGTGSGFKTFTSDTYKKQAVDQYGTLVTYEDRTNENGAATIAYPASQMKIDTFFTEVGATVTPGSGGTGSVEELGNSAVTDAEVSSVQEKNLIVVGGSCINSVASKILGGSYCGPAFTDATKGNGTGVGADQFLIKVVDSPYTTGRIAMLVAGYEAADTTKAVEYLKNEGPVSTTVGTELKKVTATYADVE